jgi:hypothetical protein
VISSPRVRFCTGWLCLAKPVVGYLPNFAKLTLKSPGNQIIAFRNVVIHQYFGIDLDLVWAIITEHISTLGASVRLRFRRE